MDTGTQSESATIFLVAIFIYSLVMVGIGFYSYKRASTLRGFYTMSGVAGSVTMALAYLSTQYSVSTFMGAPGAASQIGFGFSAALASVVFAILIPAVLVGQELMRLAPRLGLLTLPDYLRSRYYSVTLAIIAALAIIIFLLPLLAAQLLGAGVVWEVFTGYPLWVGIVGFGVVVTLYCAVGGVPGAMLTDVLQGGLMIITVVVIFIVGLFYTDAGNLSQLTSNLADIDVAKMSMPGSPNASMTYPYIASNLLLFTVCTIGLPQLLTKFYSVNSTQKLYRAVVTGGIGMWIVIMVLLGIGALGAAFFDLPERVDYFIPEFLFHYLPLFVASVLMAGLISAGMSTVDATLIAVAGAISRDIYHNLKPSVPDHTLLKLSRISTLFIGAAATVLALMQPASIFELIVFTFGSLGVLGVPIILGVRWKRATREGALAGVVIGLAYSVFGTIYPELAFGFVAGIPAMLLTAIVMVIVSVVTVPPPRSVMIAHYGSSSDKVEATEVL